MANQKGGSPRSSNALSMPSQRRSRTTRILWPCLRCATISFAYIRRCGTYWKLGKWPVTDAVANNELKTAVRRSQCSVPTRYRWTTITSSRAAFSGRAARKSAAIPVFRHHRAADLAGGAIGSRWRSRFQFARVGHQGRSEYRLRRTEDVHRAGRYPVYPAYPDRLMGLDWQTPAGRARSHPSGFSFRQRRRCPRARRGRSTGLINRNAGTPRQRWL